MDEDLPLLSNVGDILVSHYNFKFECKFEQKCFFCSAILFLETIPTGNEQTCTCFGNNTNNELSALDRNTKDCASDEPAFSLILDCHQVQVDGVTKVDLSVGEMDDFKFKCFDASLVSLTDSPLRFHSSEWCLKIWTEERSCKFCFPKVIRISYQTLPSSPSLLWVKDQDGRPSVFTYGAAVNNRSLFPCQEPPVAMATWEATVTVSDPATVLMSGDNEPVITFKNGLTHFYFWTKKNLPLSTLCLAIGYWEEHAITQKYSSSPKCRIFSPPSLINLAILELFEYVPYCLKISEEMLGPYPFPRIDFLIVPPTFGSLGMASPSVVFLSQSLLTGDGSMSSRVAHEIAHGWFGLLIGAMDWTEEWLSEGFATFTEDYIHTLVMNMSEADGNEYRELRSHIRKKILLAEVENTEDELQIMRSSKGEMERNLVDGVDATILKNGQNPLKGFMQVHYIKGYFLLKHLSDVVGIDKFITFLRAYVEEYGGRLVTSTDFLSMYFRHFPFVKNIFSIQDINENWLHNSDIPDAISSSSISEQNKLFSVVITEMTSEQMILLLENVLELDVLSEQTLKSIAEFYNLKDSNPEVQHRWLELVVKHKYRKEYPALKSFLTKHLSMGVYLYGEMIFSGNPTLKKIAKECFDSLESELEPNYKKTISKMLLASAS